MINTMPNDISSYIDFGKDDGQMQHKSIKSLFGVAIIVRSWRIMDSKYRDGNPSGKYVQMTIEINGETFLTNTGSAIIMEQLERIRQAKIANGEEELSFTCSVKSMGKGAKLFPAMPGYYNVRS